MATRCCSLSTWQVGLVIPKRRSRKRWTSPRLTVGRSNHRDQDILGARRYASAQDTTASCGSGRHRECRPTMPSRFAGRCTTANERRETMTEHEFTLVVDGELADEKVAATLFEVGCD